MDATQNITQVQLAERLGVAQQTMAHEGGTVRIPVQTLAQLAQHLNTSVEALISSPVFMSAGPRS